MTGTHVYRYPRSSALDLPSGRLRLETAGGTTLAGPSASPRFFTGFLTSPAIAARGLQAIAQVARADHRLPARSSWLDPVVTCGGDRPALRELAAAGAGPQVWEMLAAGLPYAVAPAAEKPANRLADLLALAVELAGQAEIREPLPELDALADRNGSSQLAVQARRLRQALAS
ncbi:hypothetical protein [Amycolatopsis samaneae]|uniref:Uncharacterized protein n=1 Tax=Amycolatopsis samaneae TaxID=664691 RepID=A0ABW5GNR6_9PSEU